ncbi:unnamed protein product, partial [marine sediment metagenome]
IYETQISPFYTGFGIHPSPTFGNIDAGKTRGTEGK